MNTIAAVSTPAGVGGIAVIRISGDDALDIAKKIFFPASGKQLTDYPFRTAVFGSVKLNGKTVDEALATAFGSAGSFTGEDTVEISCHGGMLVTRKVLEAALAGGAVPATAGEFTKRAFMNGKLTLTQAEAIGGVIHAKTEKHLEISHAQLGGALGKTIKMLADRLRAVVASVYAYIDYPDEDMTELDAQEMKETIDWCIEKSEKILAGERYMKAVSEGVRCVIAGKPNTGKSSLLNALAGYNRAIVTDIEGTTRDVITEQLTLGSVLLRVADTAGLRESEDIIEKAGIENTRAWLSDAELVLAVFDASSPPDERDFAVIEALGDKKSNTVAVLNKSDKGSEYADTYKRFFERAVVVSTVTEDGLAELSECVNELCGEREFGGADEIMLNARQNNALRRARNALKDASCALGMFTQDVAASDIERALASLGEIDGRAVSEDIVSEIFSKFCVGK